MTLNLTGAIGVISTILLIVAGRGGDSPTQPKPPEDFPPRVLESFVIERALVADRESLDIQFGTTFEDPEGRPLTYAATSSKERIATVKLAGVIATVYPHDEGNVTITIHATDPGGNSASVNIDLVVEPSPVHPDDDLVYSYLAGLWVAPNELSFFKKEANGLIGQGPAAYIDVDPEEVYFGGEAGTSRYRFIKSRWQKQDDYGPHQGWLNVQGTEKTGTRLHLYTPRYGAGEDHQSGCYRMVGEVELTDPITGTVAFRLFTSNALAYRLPGHVRCD